MFPYHSTSGKAIQYFFRLTKLSCLCCLLAIMYCHFQMEDLASPSLTFPSSPNSSSCFLHPLPLPPTPISLQLNDGKLLQKTRQVCSCFFYQFSWLVPSFFFSFFVLYELIAMFLDWVVDVFFLVLSVFVWMMGRFWLTKNWAIWTYWGGFMVKN